MKRYCAPAGSPPARAWRSSKRTSPLISAVDRRAPFRRPLPGCNWRSSPSGLKDGEEVITTPLTFVATLNTIVQAGGRPVLVDIDPKTRNMDMKLLTAAITPKTRAICPVHFAGLPVDMDEVYAVAQKHNLRVIEDCAHAIGAE